MQRSIFYFYSNTIVIVLLTKNTLSLTRNGKAYTIPLFLHLYPFAFGGIRLLQKLILECYHSLGTGGQYSRCPLHNHIFHPSPTFVLSDQKVSSARWLLYVHSANLNWQYLIGFLSCSGNVRVDSQSAAYVLARETLWEVRRCACGVLCLSFGACWNAWGE